MADDLGVCAECGAGAEEALVFLDREDVYRVLVLCGECGQRFEESPPAGWSVVGGGGDPLTVLALFDGRRLA